MRKLFNEGGCCAPDHHKHRKRRQFLRRTTIGKFLFLKPRPFVPVKFSLIERAFPELLASRMILVQQPMNMPLGNLVFKLDFVTEKKKYEFRKRKNTTN